LPEAQIADFIVWVKSGAFYPESATIVSNAALDAVAYHDATARRWWSFQSVTNPRGTVIAETGDLQHGEVRIHDPECNPVTLSAKNFGLAAAPGNGRVVLSWTAVHGASSYTVHRATDPAIGNGRAPGFARSASEESV
jgi:hypothetical protein